jgi:uroporphyrinogen III methyltransferase / synthase
VGAGPGDPGLITVRGAQKLSEADVILHDGLANPAFRLLARPNTEWISVGKHGGNRIWKQSEIDDAIVEHARRGKTVVRLKGGDTGVFARTAEELDRLVREGIPFEVIPGITAALAAAAYTGIPITHRDWSSAVALVTGQLQPSDGGPEIDEGIDWSALAKFPGTLIVYMGVTTASVWSGRLIEAGLSPQTPVALVRRCSWPDQEAIYCQLSDVAMALTPASQFRPPVLAIIGTVAHLGKDYNWFEKRPLKGVSVLVARPGGQSVETVRQLEALGANVISMSGVEIRPLDDFTSLDARLRALSEYAWIVFTSPNGVDHFFSRLHALGLDGRVLGHCRLAGVGPSIATALERWKMVGDFIPDANGEPWNAENLSKRLLAEFTQNHPREIRSLVVRTNRGKTTVEDSLREAGYAIDSIVAYQSLDIPDLDPEVVSAIKSTDVDYILVTSSAVASNLMKKVKPIAANATWIAISEEVANSLRAASSGNVLVSKQASIDSMITTLIDQQANGKPSR